MVSVINTVDTSHEDMIHDAQMDYYGMRLATCSSDRSVKIFDVRNGGQILIADLRGHEGPVWQVAWAHPMYGNILASCSYDRKVIIWKEENGTWEKAHEYTGHDSSVSGEEWVSLQEFSLSHQCRPTHPAVCVLVFLSDLFSFAKKAHGASVMGAVSTAWTLPGSMANPLSDRRYPRNSTSLPTSGSWSLLRLWQSALAPRRLQRQLDLQHPWVTDVPKPGSTGTASSVIVKIVKDGRVFIWMCDDPSGNSWSPKLLHKFNDVVWHVSWSITANILAVSGGDNKVTLWKESVDGQWACISDVNKGQGAVSAITEGQQNEQ
ncbi:protein SEC13 homolog [Podarcis lilfordi]|uniref:Protein SEC13 homolog n=1 Tax=Podarcis lilfordi TaxID=74358 RepID=A0AA35JWK7_9SAUR|nr:protein SEC13 homolog [Podarcis lilfordi]